MEEASTSSLMTPQKDHLSIHIVNEEDLTTSIISKMDNIVSQSHCICRVSGQLLKENKDWYHPRLISIGPLHYDKSRCTNEYKWRYFNTLLMRKPNSGEAILDQCVNVLIHNEPKARKFYPETIEMGTDQFIQVLLIDACFLIELFLESEHPGLRRTDDPFFTSGRNMKMLKDDLIMLENQLPFFIIELLFTLIPIPNHCSTKSVTELALSFFKKLIPTHVDFHPHKHSPEIHHLLDLIRLHYLPKHQQVKIQGAGVSQTHMLPRAVQLHSVGVHLQRGDNSNSPFSITFRNGELKIPPLKFNHHTETVLGNLIALEQCHPECLKIATSYAVLMKQLVECINDLEVFQDKGILLGSEGQEKEVVFMFKKLGVEMGEEFYYRGVSEGISGYKASTRRVKWETLRHVYHRTHLGMAGFTLVMFLLVFLFTGVLFSSITYLLHHFHFH